MYWKFIHAFFPPRWKTSSSACIRVICLDFINKTSLIFYDSIHSLTPTPPQHCSKSINNEKIAKKTFMSCCLEKKSVRERHEDFFSFLSLSIAKKLSWFSFTVRLANVIDEVLRFSLVKKFLDFYFAANNDYCREWNKWSQFGEEIAIVN